MDRAKQRILQRMDREFTNTQAMVVNVLTETAADGDWRYLFTNYAEIGSVTPEDIVRVAKLYFKDSNLTIGEFIPDAAPDRTVVPDAPSMDKLLSEYKPNVQIKEGEVLDPSPAAVEKRITRTTLPGGLHLALLPKTTRGDLVALDLNIRWGDEKSLAGKYAAAALAGALLMRGTKTMSRQQIQDAIQKLNATISVCGGGGRGGGGGRLSGCTASIQTTSENLVPAMRLMAEILKDPAFPEQDFDLLRTQAITGIERGRTEPATLASQTLQADLSPFPRTDVRHPRTIDEQIEDLKAVTLDDVKNFYTQFFGASHGDIVAVGAMNIADVQKAAQELFGSCKSGVPYTRIDSKVLPVTLIDKKLETPDKANAEFVAGLRIAMRDTDPDYAAIVLANYMMGGDITARLSDRIRNREGLSSSVGSSFSAPTDGDAAIMSASVISHPSNSRKVESSFRDEVTQNTCRRLHAKKNSTMRKRPFMTQECSPDPAIRES